MFLPSFPLPVHSSFAHCLRSSSGCGPVLKTTDGEEFLKAVSALNAFGGGDHPELFWCGLQV